MERLKGMLIESFLVCEGALKKASLDRMMNTYYDENGKNEAVGHYICPSCKFVVVTNYDNPFYVVQFASFDEFLEPKYYEIREGAFEMGNKNEAVYKKLIKDLPEIKERVKKIKKENIKDPVELIIEKVSKATEDHSVFGSYSIGRIGTGDGVYFSLNDKLTFKVDAEEASLIVYGKRAFNARESEEPVKYSFEEQEFVYGLSGEIEGLFEVNGSWYSLEELCLSFEKVIHRYLKL